MKQDSKKTTHHQDNYYYYESIYKYYLRWIANLTMILYV